MEATGTWSGTSDAPSRFAAEMRAARVELGISRFEGSPLQRRLHVALALKSIGMHAERNRLREHQSDAVKAVARHLADVENRPSTLVTIPTGGGKTRAFQTIVSALGSKDRSGRRHMPTVVVLVPTKVLIRQTWIGFAKHFPGIDVRSASPERMTDDDDREIPRGTGPVTLMTYAGFMQGAESGGIRPEDIDLLVMDEAHRGLSDVRQATLRPFLDACTTTAWTATPAFDDVKNVHNLLGPENEVYSITAQDLRERGLLAPLVNYVLSISLTGEEPTGETARTVKRRALVDGVLDFISNHSDPDGGLLAGKIALFYGADREHARMFADEYNRRLSGNGRRMVVLTGDDPAWRIREVLDLVRTGEITAIANAVLFVEGIDLPKLGLVVNSPSESMLKIVQQAGRVLRMDPDIPEFSPDQTGFVVDTYYKINGRVEGRPRFLFEAIGDWSIARAKETEPRPFAEPSPVATSAPGTDHGSALIGRAAGADPNGLGFDVAEIESVVRMLRLRDSGIPLKTDDHVDLADFLGMMNTTAISSPEIVAAFDEMQARWEEPEPARFGGEEFAAGLYRRTEGGGSRFCIRRSDAERLARLIGLPVGGYEKWNGGRLSLAPLAAQFGVGFHPGSRLASFWSDLEAATRRGGHMMLEDGPLVGRFTSRWRRRILTVDPADAVRIERHLGFDNSSVAPWQAGYLNRIETARALRTSENNREFKTAWDAMMAAEAAGSLGAIRAGRMRRNIPAFYLHQDDLGAFVAEFHGNYRRPAADRDPDEISFTEIVKRLGHHSVSKKTEAVRSRVYAAAAAGQPVVVGGTTISCQWKSNKTSQQWMFREADLDAFRREFDTDVPARTDEWLTLAAIRRLTGIDEIAEWNDLARQVEEGKIPSIPDGPVRFGKRSSQGIVKWCVHHEDLGRVLAAGGNRVSTWRTSPEDLAEISEGWVGRNGFKAAYQSSSGKAFMSAMDDIEARAGAALHERTKGFSEPVTVRHGNLDIEMRFVRSGCVPVWTYRKDQTIDIVNEIRASAGIMPVNHRTSKTRLTSDKHGRILDIQSWTNKAQAAKRLNVSPYQPAFEQKWQDMTHQAEDGASPVVLGGREVEAGMMKDGSGKTVFRLHEAHLGELAQAIGKPRREIFPKTRNDLTRLEAAERLHVTQVNKTFMAAWDALVARTESGEARPDVRMRCCRRGTGAKHAWCIDARDLGAFASAAGLSIHKLKTPDWVSRREYGTMIGVSATRSKALVEAWRELEENMNENGTSTLDGETYRFERLLSGAQTFFYLHRDDCAKLREAIMPSGPTAVP